MNRYIYKDGKSVIKVTIQNIDELAIEINSLGSRLQASTYATQLEYSEYIKLNNQLKCLFKDPENQEGLIDLFNYSFKEKTTNPKIAIRGYLKKGIACYLTKPTKLKLKLMGVL